MSDVVRRFIIGSGAAVVPALICWVFGRWFGMTFLGLPDPDGGENIAAAFLGLISLAILAGGVAAVLALGRLIDGDA